MEGSRKSKSLTWASDVNLRQVRTFLLDECPSQVGKRTQDHRQAKTLWSLQSGDIKPDDILPPGFKRIHTTKSSRVELSPVTLMGWKCPPRFVLDGEWLVVAGEESKEIESQRHREMRVIEATYPHQSAIPSTPLESMDMKNAAADDRNPPIVPLMPIEEDETDMDASFGTQTTNSNQMITQTPGTSASGRSISYGIPASVAEPSLAAALASVLPKSSNVDLGNLIDPHLLIKILQEPKVIAQVLPSHSLIPHSVASPSNTSCDPINITRKGSLSTIGSLHPPQIIAGPIPYPSSAPNVKNSAASPPPAGAPTTKDLNYYKSLIQQHGGKKQDMPPQFHHRSNHWRGTSKEPSNNMQPTRDSKPKKLCMFFNTSRGCRNGTNCSYLHDNTSSQQTVRSIPEIHIPKRVKFG